MGDPVKDRETPRILTVKLGKPATCQLEIPGPSQLDTPIIRVVEGDGGRRRAESLIRRSFTHHTELGL